MKTVLTLGVAALLALAAAGSGAQVQQTPVSPDGTCPAGTHLRHASGVYGVVDPDTFKPVPGAWDDYHCATDPPAGSLVCGAHGQSVDVGGLAACACQEGYAGDTCTACATGFELTGTAAPQCTAIAANTAVQIVGAASVVPYGGSAVLSAQTRPSASGATRPVEGEWRLDGDAAVAGCLAPVQGGTCAATASGSAVRYVAPTQGSSLVVNTLTFLPPAGPPTDADVKAGPPGQIPVNGVVNPHMMPLVNKVLDFMRQRCIGAGSLGVARHGKVVLALGLGMKDGRNAATIFNPACSSDVTDPFVPSAGEMQMDTPFMVGSVSKAAGYATSRWAIKRALQRNDVDVRLIAASANRLVSATRGSLGRLRADVWNLASNGQATHTGGVLMAAARDFSVARISDSRFVVALRTQQNTFDLYAFAIDASGVPQETSSLHGVTAVKQVEAAAVTGQRIVVGLRRSDDVLEMRSFALDAGGTLSLLDTLVAEPSRDIRLVAMPALGRVVGVQRLAFPDVLKFSVWDVGATGQLTRSQQTQLGDAFAGVGSYDVSALSSNSLILAARNPAAGSVSLATLSVTTSIALQGSATLAFAGDVRVKALSPSVFALATRDAQDNGGVRQFVIDAQSNPVQLASAVAGEPFVSMDLVNTSTAGWGMGLVTATRGASDALKLSAWIAGGAGIPLLRQSVGTQVVKDFGWTDADVEALSLTGLDLPGTLLPARLYNIVAGHVPPPIGPLNVGSAETDEEDGDDGDNVPLDQCVASQAPSFPMADARWKNVRLRDLLAHRTGLPKSNISAGALINPHLPALRGLATPADWIGQQDLLAQEWGAANVQNARVALGLPASTNPNAPGGLLLPRLTLEELLLGSASRCLPNQQRAYRYSNTDPLWMVQVAEHVSGKKYTAPVGKPGDVEQTLLKEFVGSELGLAVNEATGMDGLFARPAAPDANDLDPFTGSTVRIWTAGTQSYTRLFTDVKRPHCLWSSGSCVMKAPRLSWNGADQKVPQNLDASGTGTATGALAMQLVPQLRFMSRFWSGGYDDGVPADGNYDPSIGEARNGVWTVGHTHNGSADGTLAYAAQFGIGCSLPGIDLIVSFNQRNDAQCVSDAPACAANARRYDNLRIWINDSLCQDIDWTKVKPVALP